MTTYSIVLPAFGLFLPARSCRSKARSSPCTVSAAPFRDRAVHHALCAMVEPIFEAGFIDHTFANRIGKGTHRAIDAYERYRDSHADVLRCDIYRYFPAIDHAILKSSAAGSVVLQRSRYWT